MKYCLILSSFFVLLRPSFGQEIDAYNLSYASFLGGNHFEQARDIAVDQDGNFYITGGTSSPDFPVTSGAYDTLYNNLGSATVGNWGPMMVFVTKFSPEGELIWSTFLGGPNYDRAYAIEVDAEGYVYVGGRAGDDFPTTSGAFQEDFIKKFPTNNLYGHQNGFISKLSPDGAELIWSTYYGSDSFGFFRDIDIDEDGYVYGILNAVKNVPLGMPADAYDPDLNGNFDMVPVKFTPDGAEVVWATFLGGSGEDRGGPSIRVGPDKTVFVAGATLSTDFPVTPNAVQTQAGGKSDMFITRLSADGKSLIYSTYFGGSENEFSETHSLTVDHLGQAHIACATKSIDINTTPGALKPTKNNISDFDVLLAKLSSDGTTTLACSYFGGSANDSAEGLHVDTAGYFYVGGGTNSNDFPTTSNALQTQLSGGHDGFVIKTSPSFDTLLLGSYFGGEEDDAVRAFSVSENGTIGCCCSGQTESEDLPVTSNPLQANHNSPNSRADSYFTIWTPEEDIVNSAQEELVSPDLKFYPNPTNDFLYWESSHQINHITIMDLVGRKLMNIDALQAPLNLGFLSAGYYLLEVEFDDGGSLTSKVMVF